MAAVDLQPPQPGDPARDRRHHPLRDRATTPSRSPTSTLQKDTPYNTRLNAGLPPTPIGNPGLAAIKAAARPANVNYIYFVVKPGTCGEHSFTASEAEFEKLAAEYQAALAGRRAARRPSAEPGVTRGEATRVLGHPVAHSRSPAMQNAALAALGLGDEWSYEAIEMPPADFAGADPRRCPARGSSAPTSPSRTRRRRWRWPATPPPPRPRSAPPTPSASPEARSAPTTPTPRACWRRCPSRRRASGRSCWGRAARPGRPPGRSRARGRASRSGTAPPSAPIELAAGAVAPTERRGRGPRWPRSPPSRPARPTTT